jgi:hypothetical protein
MTTKQGFFSNIFYLEYIRLEGVVLCVVYIYTNRLASCLSTHQSLVGTVN